MVLKFKNTRRVIDIHKWIIDLDAEREEYKRELAWIEKECGEDTFDNEDRCDTVDPDVSDSGDNETAFFDTLLEDDSEQFIEEDHYISVGDEIGRWDAPGGIVLGRICNRDGNAVCYKIWVETNEPGGGYVDYVQANNIALHELCGDAEWSLQRIGYKLIVEDDSGFSYFYNKKTGDIALW